MGILFQIFIGYYVCVCDWENSLINQVELVSL